MSGGFGRGLAFLKEQQEHMGGGFGNRMQKLWLRNGDVARFYFVQDHDEIAVPLVHMVSRKKRNGDYFNVDVLCGRLSYSEDPSVCSLCLEAAKQRDMVDLPDHQKIRGPFFRYVALVWVDFIIHATRKEGANWTPVKLAGRTDTLYKEDVKDFYMFIMRERITDQIGAFLAGDPTSPDEPPPTTILDRVWKLTVTGEGPKKQEILSSDQPGKLAPEVVEARKSAPDLTKAIINEFGESPRRSTTVAEGDGLDRSAAASDGDDVTEYDAQTNADGEGEEISF